MAARPILTCEVAMGSDNYDGLDDAEEFNEMVQRAIFEATEKERQNAEQSKCGTIYPPVDTYVPTIEDLQEDAIKSGYSGHGEMFSTQAMVNLARKHQVGRYNVVLVKHDLLDMIEEVNEDDNGANHEIIRSEVEKEEDHIELANLNLDGDNNELARSDNGNSQPSSSIISLVHRLMSGHLTAVW